MKKTFFLSLLALTAVLLFTQIPQAEARRHCRSSNTSLQLSVGNTYYNNPYVVRRCARPVIIPAAPVYVATPYGYAYPTPVAHAVPGYVEEVYVAPAPRTIGFGGLSFSWNFFK